MTQHTLKLETTDAQFHEAHVELDKVRSSSVSVRINVTHLKNLLRDHSAMVRRLNDAGIEVKNE